MHRRVGAGGCGQGVGSTKGPAAGPAAGPGAGQPPGTTGPGHGTMSPGFEKDARCGVCSVREVGRAGSVAAGTH